MSTIPETNNKFAPKIECIVRWCFLLGWPISRGSVSFRECYIPCIPTPLTHVHQPLSLHQQKNSWNFSSWWLYSPSEKTCSSNWIMKTPRVRVFFKQHIWNHQTYGLLVDSQTKTAPTLLRKMNKTPPASQLTSKSASKAWWKVDTVCAWMPISIVAENPARFRIPLSWICF